ncbi:MAG: DegT/DnrJ/EryC1/StrS aminotransferase family protein [Patescibacteria group bacterium]
MKFYRKPIFTDFAPNSTVRDFKIAAGFIFLPWMWRKLRVGDSPTKVENWLKKYFGAKHAASFDSGRSAIYYALKAIGVKEGDEVLLQGYTCAVVGNAVIWTGAKPIYVDINRDLNMNPGDLEKKITPKSKVLIIQHTFGLPANLDELISAARKNDLKVIEDCAHSLGAEYKGKRTGTFGDIGIFSFGSNKIVSCARGGALITNSDVLAVKLDEFRSQLPLSKKTKVLQHLFSYLIFAIAKPMYNLLIGKMILALAKKIHLTARIIYPAEKKTQQVAFYPSMFPNALAAILLAQLENLEESNKHREEIAKLYCKLLENKTLNPSSPARQIGQAAPDKFTSSLLRNKSPVPHCGMGFIPLNESRDSKRVWLYYPIFTDQSNKLASEAKRHGIMLGADWTGSVIVPKGIDIGLFGYKIGECPAAEHLSVEIINLPTSRRIRNKEAMRIVELVNNFYNQQQ